MHFIFFFFNDTATTEIYTLSLHDALPILLNVAPPAAIPSIAGSLMGSIFNPNIVEQEYSGNIAALEIEVASIIRSEEHTSELQSRQYLVCRLLLEKKKNKKKCYTVYFYTT